MHFSFVSFSEIFLCIQSYIIIISNIRYIFLNYYRYRAVKHPMEYSQTQASGNHRMIFASIFLIWGIAVAVGLPILFGLNNR